jgi:plastocyanin
MKTLKNVLFAGSFVFIVLFLGSQAGCTVQKDNPNKDTTNAAIDSNTVIIRNFSFTPSQLIVKPGVRVTWRNQDGMDHTVTSNDGLFDSGNLKDKASFGYVFTDAGTYQYHCRLHPQMTGSVVVK